MRQVLVLGVASAAILLPSSAGAPRGAAGGVDRTRAGAAVQTIVSLTFDDGDATQYTVRSMLSSREMHATFFLNSPRISGDSYYMTWSQVNDLAADGNEIAGHTAYHEDLVQSDPVEAQREI